MQIILNYITFWIAYLELSFYFLKYFLNYFLLIKLNFLFIF